MKILALDIATSTGWAAGETSAAPTFGCYRIQTDGRNFGMAMNDFSRWLDSMIDAYMPDQIVYEKPITTIHGKTSLETKCLLIGLCMHAESVAYDHGLPISWVNNATVKKHFTGHGGFGKKTKPYPMIVAAHQRGWMVETHDEADACGVWDYGIHCHDPENAHLHDPIMAGTS